MFATLAAVEKVDGHCGVGVAYTHCEDARLAIWPCVAQAEIRLLAAVAVESCVLITAMVLI